MSLGALIGHRELKSAKDIREAIKLSKYFNGDLEAPDQAGTMLIFDTSKQHTWLVCTRERLYCILDDVRSEVPNVNWSMGRQDVLEGSTVTLSIEIRANSDSAGFINFGQRHQNYYYSYKLFVDKAVREEIRKLILKNMLRPDALGPAESVAVEGTAIKIPVASKEAIAQGTIKALPGRLEVLDGDDKMPDIKLFLKGDNPGREFTIGRVNNAASMPMNHIGFKTQTVSAYQGKLTVAPDGRYTIYNFVDPVEKNPIVVNAETLGLGESRALADNDIIEIGTVKMQYHAE
jgi:hypothetical protein